jgi:hypothetical protein
VLEYQLARHGPVLEPEVRRVKKAGCRRALDWTGAAATGYIPGA